MTSLPFGSGRCSGVAAACVLALALGGCSGGNSGFIEGPMYPAQLRQSRCLDVQVFRDETRVRFTNSSATPIPACTMWVNAWYSRPLDAVAIGETVEMSLFDFKDQYGGQFRAGGFFATDKPTKLVLVQLELPTNELVGLIVVNEFQE
jgi:hypothetical protein